MDGVTVAAILKIVAEYGVLGLGWVAWILTMGYLQVERKRYQALTLHIIEHFTKVSMAEKGENLLDASPPEHRATFTKLFGKG